MFFELVRKFVRFSSLCAFAFWQGGFVFYSGIVVPLGGEMWGDRTQGFLTRQVAPWLHVAAWVALGLWALDCLLSPGKKVWRMAWIVAMAIAVLGLVYLYPRMDAYLDPISESIENPRDFRVLHRIYLWTSTILWLMSLVWLWLIIDGTKGTAEKSHGCVKNGFTRDDTAMEA